MNGLFEETVVKYNGFPVKILHTTRLANEMSFHPHWHDRVEILYIEEGCMEVICESRKFAAHERDLVFFHPRQLHGGRAVGERISYRVLMFELARFPEGDKDCGGMLTQIFTGNIRFLSLIRDERLSGILADIFHEYEHPVETSPLFIRGKVYELLSVLLRFHIDTAYLPPEKDDRFDQVIGYIGSHYTEPLSTRQVAARFGYEESYFCRRFRSRTSLSFVEYVRILRLERACTLLRNGQESVQAVAERCGYGDVNYFIRCFRKRYGTTPERFREKD